MDSHACSLFNKHNSITPYAVKGQHVQPSWMQPGTTTIWEVAADQQRIGQHHDLGVHYQCLQATGGLHLDQQLCVVISTPNQPGISQLGRCFFDMGIQTEFSIRWSDHVSQHEARPVPQLVKYADNNCITLKTGVKDEDRLRGSNNLVKYILVNNKMVIQQQRTKREEIETARLASLI